jgi:hypothetical protein
MNLRSRVIRLERKTRRSDGADEHLRDLEIRVVPSRGKDSEPDVLGERLVCLRLGPGPTARDGAGAPAATDLREAGNGLKRPSLGRSGRRLARTVEATPSRGLRPRGVQTRLAISARPVLPSACLHSVYDE